MTSKKGILEINYDNKKLFDFPYDQTSTIYSLKKDLSNKLSLDANDLILIHNGKKITNNKEKISSLCKTSNKLNLNNINCNFKFSQVDNDYNFFEFKIDMLKTTTEEFKKMIYSFFKAKMDEINYKISSYEFVPDNLHEEQQFFDIKKTLSSHFKSNTSNNFYFLIKNSKLVFYKNIIKEEEEKKEEKIQQIPPKVELRKNVAEGKRFTVLIQTYNHVTKEVEVYPEMTIGDLKYRIEETFMVRKEYQELLYLVYRLNDDNKLIKDYYIRPQGIIFLRGFYFPLVFVDYYDKKKKNVISINIAEQVKVIKEEMIQRLNLDKSFSYKLILNGRELNERSYLIDFNVQRMQMIYFK